MKPHAILAVFFFIASAISHAQRPEPDIESLDEARAEKVIFLNSNYLAYHPEKTDAKKKIPLVIYLHGAGGVGTDIRKITGQSRGVALGIQQFKKGPCLIVAPQCSRDSEKSDERGGWIHTDLNLFLDHLLEKFNDIDPDRVYLTGNSMGGYGSWMWGGNSPERFAAIAPVVGGIGPGGPKDVTPDLEKWAANLAKVPVYAFAGEKDKVVPAERSERMVAAIKKAGGKQANILVIAEEGHGASRRVYTSEKFFEWMFSQKRAAKTE